MEQNHNRDQRPINLLLSELMAKLAMMKRIEKETGLSTAPLIEEAKRQIGQALRGEIVTKSGEED